MVFRIVLRLATVKLIGHLQIFPTFGLRRSSQGFWQRWCFDTLLWKRKLIQLMISFFFNRPRCTVTLNSIRCIFIYTSIYRPFSRCIDQAGLGAFTAKSGRKHYNPPLLTVMWMNFDSPNFPSFCSLSAIISFHTCSDKCILYVLSFHKCIKIKYKMVNMYGVFRD